MGAFYVSPFLDIEHQESFIVDYPSDCAQDGVCTICGSFSYY